MLLYPTDSFSTMDEKALVVFLNNGEDGAFTEIYNRYWKKLFTVAANKLNNLSEAEELVQDVFLDIWNRKENLTINTSIAAYLAVAVKYKIFDHLAKRAQHVRYYQHAVQTLEKQESSTEQWLQCEELKERLLQSVAALPEKCRLVFELSRHNGLTQKQIASKMGIAEKTVEAHLGKALRTLRTSLGSVLSFLLLLPRL